MLPRNLTAEWQAHFTTEEHKSHVGLIGNLVALSEMQNKSAQDEPWVAKRKRFKGSQFKSTADLASNTAWTPKTIQQRNIDFCDWILKRWPDFKNSEVSVP